MHAGGVSGGGGGYGKKDPLEVSAFFDLAVLAPFLFRTKLLHQGYHQTLRHLLLNNVTKVARATLASTTLLLNIIESMHRVQYAS